LFLSFASFYQEYDTCLTDVIKKTPLPVPEVFLFYVAEAYQTSYILKKAKLCPSINYYDLKKTVFYSGKYDIFLNK